MGCLKRYESVQDILREFFELRLHYYKLRKDWLVGSLGADAAKMSNQARFVLEKIEGKVSIGKNVRPVAQRRQTSFFSDFLFLFLFFFEQRTNPNVNWSACWCRKATSQIQWLPGPELRRRYWYKGWTHINTQHQRDWRHKHLRFVISLLSCSVGCCCFRFCDHCDFSSKFWALNISERDRC